MLKLDKKMTGVLSAAILIAILIQCPLRGNAADDTDSGAHVNETNENATDTITVSSRRRAIPSNPP